MAKRILLVEDEETLRHSIKLNLDLEGYEVVDAADGETAINLFHKGRYDLIILDVMLPGVDGFTVCQTIRLTNDKVPVLFLTARGTSADKVQGLQIGADDYMTKPFNLEEFLLRVQLLVKRSAQIQGGATEEFSTYTFGPNKVDFTTFEIETHDGEKKTISKREIHLLKLLIERRGKVVSREEILETVWGYDVYPSTRTIDNYILAFRKYFEPQPREPKHFHSIRGVGYKFTE